MVITCGDNGYIRVQNGELILEVDPQGNRTKPDIVLRTETNPEQFLSGVGEVAAPGEYEIKEVEIRGFQDFGESTKNCVKTVYLVRWEDIKLVFLGSVRSIPETSILKEISEPDVLFVPIGPDGMPAPEAAKLVRQLEPAAVVPTHSKNWKEFAKELGRAVEPRDKFVFKKKDLIPKESTLVVLSS